MADQKRIAKNALMLFFRTFITIGISLYVSRRLLLVLGESDFGIYSVVGGIAVIFSFLEKSLKNRHCRKFMKNVQKIGN